MRRYTAKLVIGANGSMRVAQRPRLTLDEVAYVLNVEIPDAWGTVVGTIDVKLPEPPSARLRTEPEVKK